jgi:hypothetical protein
MDGSYGNIAVTKHGSCHLQPRLYVVAALLVVTLVTIAILGLN